VGARFSAPVQTGPGGHLASTKGTESFPGVKRPERGVDHPPSSSAEVKKRVKLYLYPLLALGAYSGVRYLIKNRVVGRGGCQTAFLSWKCRWSSAI